MLKRKFSRSVVNGSTTCIYILRVFKVQQMNIHWRILWISHVDWFKAVHN